jgi:hypothetical protein
MCSLHVAASPDGRDLPRILNLITRALRGGHEIDQIVIHITPPPSLQTDRPLPLSTHTRVSGTEEP